jgi:hypothetical protein
MDRNVKHMHAKSSESDQRVEPSKPIESSSCATSGAPCDRSPTCNDYGIACRYSNSTSTDSIIAKHFGQASDGNLPNNHGSSCSCPLCREFIEYNEYTASVGSEGQGSSSRIWLSDESRSFKQPHPDATGANIESVTGIPTGVTI